MTVLYTANPRSAYRDGHLGGSHRVADVLHHGGFGLGALGDNDGELVVLDGIAYRTAADGATAPVDPEATTPYATVMPFDPERRFELGALDREAFERAIGDVLPLRNRIWALRIHGDFDVVTAGASDPQSEPYRRMAEVMEDYAWIDHRSTRGTLVAFACPGYLLGIDLVGIHCHWLSDDRTQGGHVTSFRTRAVTVEAAEARAFTVELADDDDLRARDLTPTN